MVRQKSNYYLEYKRHHDYRPVLDSNGRTKMFNTIDSARKYATSLLLNDYTYELIAVQGGGKFLGFNERGKPVYQGQTAGIVKLELGRPNPTGIDIVSVYSNYLTHKTYLLKKDGSLGKVVE